MENSKKMMKSKVEKSNPTSTIKTKYTSNIKESLIQWGIQENYKRIPQPNQYQ